MKHTEQTLVNSIDGVVLVIVVAGAGLYLIKSALTVAVPTAATANYPTMVLNEEFEPNGIFLKTKQLGTPNQVVAPTQAPVSNDEVGKTDLSSYE